MSLVEYCGPTTTLAAMLRTQYREGWNQRQTSKETRTCAHTCNLNTQEAEAESGAAGAYLSEWDPVSKIFKEISNNNKWEINK